jgi:hypothetical protein
MVMHKIRELYPETPFRGSFRFSRARPHVMKGELYQQLQLMLHPTLGIVRDKSELTSIIEVANLSPQERSILLLWIENPNTERVGEQLGIDDTTVLFSLLRTFPILTQKVMELRESGE